MYLTQLGIRSLDGLPLNHFQFLLISNTQLTVYAGVFVRMSVSMNVEFIKILTNITGTAHENYVAPT